MNNTIQLVLILFLCQTCFANIQGCPNECECTSFSFTCMDCIRHFHRGMTTEAGCVCLGYFKEKVVIQPYCCPNNCSTCDSTGCLTCPVNYQLHYSVVYDVNVCICEEYYTSYGTDFCYCMSFINATSFYYNHITQTCHTCPPGCQCSDPGCFKCDNNTLRYITMDASSRMVCPCKYPFVDNGTGCVCYKDCACN